MVCSCASVGWGNMFHISVWGSNMCAGAYAMLIPYAVRVDGDGYMGMDVWRETRDTLAAARRDTSVHCLPRRGGVRGACTTTITTAWVLGWGIESLGCSVVLQPMSASLSASLRADYGGALKRCVAIIGRADQHSAGAEGAPYRLIIKYRRFWGGSKNGPRPFFAIV
eukprot:scaffold10868_cov121-Isochrysis_galbana.AAC.6